MTGSTASRTTGRRGVTGAVRPAWVVAGLLVLVTAVFIAQNRDRVSIHLFSATFTAPMWLLLTMTVLVGGAVGALLRSRR
ncbi:hypothetical protein [Trujillonella humicola]|uniref:hypothetical protein n=1 Tax=Trujillonella humicola TaxID=3383699 RepID=UPI0039059E2F